MKTIIGLITAISAATSVSYAQEATKSATYTTQNVKYSVVNFDDKKLNLSGDIVKITGGKTETLCSFNVKNLIVDDEKTEVQCGKYVATIYLEKSWGKTYLHRELALPGADVAFNTTKTFVPWNVMANGNSAKHNDYNEGFINGFKYVQMWDKL